jgi:hypothetical protein
MLLKTFDMGGVRLQDFRRNVLVTRRHRTQRSADECHVAVAEAMVATLFHVARFHLTARLL